MANFDLIVFDWDGTLMDSTAGIAESVQAAFADLDMPVPTREQASHVIGLGLAEALEYLMPGSDTDTQRRMMMSYREHFLRRGDSMVLFPGVIELLTTLAERGYLLGVATGKSRVGLDQALAACGLEGRFHATRCVDESFSKPNPAMLLEVIERTGVSAGRTLMVGDTTHDVLMAHNAGVTSVALAQGAHDEATLRAASPRALLRDLAELELWLTEHG